MQQQQTGQRSPLPQRRVRNTPQRNRRGAQDEELTKHPHIRALMIRTGFWEYYALVVIRTHRNSIGGLKYQNVGPYVRVSAYVC